MPRPAALRLPLPIRPSWAVIRAAWTGGLRLEKTLVRKVATDGLDAVAAFLCAHPVDLDRPVWWKGAWRTPLMTALYNPLSSVSNWSMAFLLIEAGARLTDAAVAAWVTSMEDRYGHSQELYSFYRSRHGAEAAERVRSLLDVEQSDVFGLKWLVLQPVNWDTILLPPNRHRTATESLRRVVLGLAPVFSQHLGPAPTAQALGQAAASAQQSYRLGIALPMPAAVPRPRL